MIGKVSKALFGKVKPLTITAESTPDGIMITSVVNKNSYEITSPLETLLATLPACQVSTMRILTKTGKFKVKNMRFTRIESGYETMHFMEGGKNNHIENVKVWAEIETNGTQEELDELEKQMENHCPVYQTFVTAGIKITNHWKNIQTID